MRRISRERGRADDSARRKRENGGGVGKDEGLRRVEGRERWPLSRGKPTTAALTADSPGLYQHSDKLYPVLCSSDVANIVVLPW